MDSYDVEFWTLMKALVGTQNQEKALVVAFSLIQTSRRFVYSSTQDGVEAGPGPAAGGHRLQWQEAQHGHHGQETEEEET